MESYKNLGGNSGVTAFELGSDYIKVQFKHGARIYTYSTQNISIYKIEQMKLLANSGKGLGSFINLNRDVRDGYDR